MGLIIDFLNCVTISGNNRSKVLHSYVTFLERNHATSSFKLRTTGRTQSTTFVLSINFVCVCEREWILCTDHKIGQVTNKV
jgi:hypothetical protein